MEDALKQFFANQPSWALGVEILAILAILGKAADWLVGEAVVLSERSGLPKVIIGATVVSLGTTAPEAAVSVLAALQGNPEVALGNATGSIICDTGLILGIACLILPLKLPRQIVNRQGWLQFGAGILLVAACWPWDGSNPFKTGGVLPQCVVGSTDKSCVQRGLCVLRRSRCWTPVRIDCDGVRTGRDGRAGLDADDTLQVWAPTPRHYNG